MRGTSIADKLLHGLELTKGEVKQIKSRKAEGICCIKYIRGYPVNTKYRSHREDMMVVQVIGEPKYFRIEFEYSCTHGKEDKFWSQVAKEVKLVPVTKHYWYTEDEGW